MGADLLRHTWRICYSCWLQREPATAAARRTAPQLPSAATAGCLRLAASTIRAASCSLLIWHGSSEVGKPSREDLHAEQGVDKTPADVHSISAQEHLPRRAIRPIVYSAWSASGAANASIVKQLPSIVTMSVGLAEPWHQHPWCHLTWMEWCFPS